MKEEFFLSFIEEGIMNPKYDGYMGGRIEVSTKEDFFTVEEIRFFTNKIQEFTTLRERWDFEYVTKSELNTLREIVKENYQEEI